MVITLSGPLTDSLLIFFSHLVALLHCDLLAEKTPVLQVTGSDRLFWSQPAIFSLTAPRISGISYRRWKYSCLFLDGSSPSQCPHPVRPVCLDLLCGCCPRKFPSLPSCLRFPDSQTPGSFFFLVDGSLRTASSLPFLVGTFLLCSSDLLSGLRSWLLLSQPRWGSEAAGCSAHQVEALMDIMFSVDAPGLC